MTGVNPERHGIFGFLEGLLSGDTRRELVERSRPVSSLSVNQPFLLDILGRAGKHVMCVNLPMSYPPRPVNGIMITGMLTPSEADNFTYPPELRDELDDYVIDIANAATPEEISNKRYDYDLPTWVKRCTEIVRLRAKTVCRLGTKHPWDFGFVVFTGTDRISHSLWTEIMTFVQQPSAKTEMERLLQDFFVELDNALGTLVDAFPDAALLLTSDHGFGARADHTVFPDVWLERKGFLVRRRGGSGRGLRRGVRRLIRRALDVLLPARLKRRILSKATDRQTRMLASLDRERSVAYFGGLDAASFGVVRLVEQAVAGLDEEKRSQLIDQIIAALKEMRDPETGEPVLEGVYRREEIFGGATVMGPTVPGPNGDVPDHETQRLPEIVLKFREGYTGRTDPLTTELIGPPPQDSYIGVHRVEGMFLTSGGPFKVLGEVPPLKLADIAPSVLYLSGLPVPTNMQGEVPLGLLSEDYVKTHPLEKTERVTEVTRAADESTGAYTPDQEKDVRDHLRHLGYLE